MADHNSAHAHLELRLVLLSKYKHTVFLFTDNTCGHLKWVTLGLSDIWLSHDTFYVQAAFKIKVKQGYLINLRMEKQLDESEKCLNYRLYKKEFCFENYFNIWPLPLSKYICKFRCLSHNLPNKKGRFFKY